jgi:hypothetical protein
VCRPCGKGSIFVLVNAIPSRVVDRMVHFFLVLKDDDLVHAEDRQCSGNGAGKISFLVMRLGTVQYFLMDTLFFGH